MQIYHALQEVKQTPGRPIMCKIWIVRRPKGSKPLADGMAKWESGQEGGK